MKQRIRSLMLLSLACLLPAPLKAQQNPPDITHDFDNLESIQRSWLVQGRVRTLQGDPVRGARVVAENITVAGALQTLVTNYRGEFQVEYRLSGSFVKTFMVDLKVSKKGYRDAHRVIDFGGSDKSQLIEVTLRDPKEDPELLSQADLISGVAPRLKKLAASDGLSAASEKDYARGVDESLDRNHPDRALLSFASVTNRDAACIGCQTMFALAELQSGDWDGAESHIVDAVKKGRADPKAGRAEPALVLGVMESWQHHPDRASSFFAEAVKFAPQDPLALQELGRSQSSLQNWDAADAYLHKAIDAGAGPDARFLRVEALLGKGDPEEANKEMTRYLAGRDVKKMPSRIRVVWERVQDKMKAQAAYAKAKTDVDQPIDYLHRTMPELKGLEPASSQAPLESILTAVGENVAAFFRNLPNTTSLERIHQEKLHANGKVIDAQDQRFHYLCLMQDEAGGPSTSEHRADLSGNECVPHGAQEGYMLTLGFVSVSLIFHPFYQPESMFRYLGRQKVDGRDTFVIAFAQRPAKARFTGTFRSGGTTMTTLSQGVAWVDSENYHVLRLRTDLLKPLPEVRLKRKTTEIAYAETRFRAIAEGLWLPQEVMVTVEWNGKLLRNTHQYSDFRVFDVDVKDKIQKLKETGLSSNAPTNPKSPR